MWHSLKIGTVIVAVVGLVLTGVAVAHAVDDSGNEREVTGAEQIVVDALAPLLEDQTLTQEQVDAVAGELAPLIARARFQDQTQGLVKKLGRLAAEIAEVLGMPPDDLGEQLGAGITLAELAEANGSRGEELVRQVTDHIAAHLAVQVTSGKLDQARADEVVATTEQTLNDLIDVQHPFGTVLKERRNQAMRAAGLNAAADALGMSIDDVRAELEEGKTLAQLAEVEGVSEGELIDAILAPVVRQLERAVERGRLTEAAAAEVLEKATERTGEAMHKAPGA